MTIQNTDITIDKVNKILGENKRNVTELCMSDKINPWSKWKPIMDTCDTLTDEILKKRNYGIKPLESNNPNELIQLINTNNNVGYTYERPIPTTPKRLGDFRYYHHIANVPMEGTYKDGTVQNIGGVTSGNHSAYEIPLAGIEVTDVSGNSPYITKNDIYIKYDKLNNTIPLHRGAIVTDGTNTVWYSSKLYWWTTQMQRFANKDVQIYEFMTNAINTPTTPYVAKVDDIFMALPYPTATIKVKSDTMAGGQKAKVHFHATQSSTNNKLYNVELQFSSIGTLYEGGTINNIVVKLCKDEKGIYPIAIARGIPNTVTLGLEEKTPMYTATLTNNTTAMMCWLCLWFDGSLQKSIQAFVEMPQPIL